MINVMTFKSTLLSSVETVFETMLFMDIEETPEIEYNSQQSSLLGTVSYTGQNIEGCFSIKASLDDSKAITAAMLGLDSTDDISDTDTYDAIGEICNMITGSIKAELLPEFGDTQLCIPQITTGSLLSSQCCAEAVNTVLNIEIDGQFAAQISLMCKSEMI